MEAHEDLKSLPKMKIKTAPSKKHATNRQKGQLNLMVFLGVKVGFTLNFSQMTVSIALARRPMWVDEVRANRRGLK